jgi:hypothetical protein
VNATETTLPITLLLTSTIGACVGPPEMGREPIAPAHDVDPTRPAAAREEEGTPAAAAPRTAERRSACAADVDCGYDAASGACDSDPRSNRQPPIVDQGILCYCDADRRACATLRVPPVPCESDASCAVRHDPRPHPVAASATFPHERGRPCRETTITITCERTNICTMHRHACGAP